MRTFAKFSNVNSDHAVRYSHKYDESDEEAWRSFRYFGLFASFCALGFGAVAVCSGSWLVGPGQSVRYCPSFYCISTCNVRQRKTIVFSNVLCRPSIHFYLYQFYFFHARLFLPSGNLQHSSLFSFLSSPCDITRLLKLQLDALMVWL